MVDAQQRGAQKNTRGCLDNLLIDKLIGDEVKQKRKSLSVAWVDVKKAFDSINRDYMLHLLKTLKFPSQICNSLERITSQWRTTLSYQADSNKTCNIAIQRGMLQGDTLSSMWFIPQSTTGWKVFVVHSRLSHHTNKS